MLVQVLGRLLSALNRLSGCRLCRASSRGPGPQAFGKEGEMGSPGLPQEPRLSAAEAPEPDLRTGGDGGLSAALGAWRRSCPEKRCCRSATLPQWSAWHTELTRAGSWASGLFRDGTDGAVPAGIRVGGGAGAKRTSNPHDERDRPAGSPSAIGPRRTSNPHDERDCPAGSPSAIGPRRTPRRHVRVRAKQSRTQEAPPQTPKVKLSDLPPGVWAETTLGRG
uniref:Uncharacterized protein n=1 Tax=Rangifer tarandus platyrhynchus TaxID=3082113 RepID=A0ACB0E8L6_RANTA|nr:unnamed protein product [Rangifer tarandus platyrhynchus]